MKIDLHLHSKHSTRPSQWILQKIGCPESFSEPLELLDLTRRRGLDALTLTDHNTIAGGLEIAHLPGTFISEEVTTYFPEDRCKVHVLAYDIDEAVHREIQGVRENIYDLVKYLRDKDILHSLAHPLFSVNDRLNMDHFERFLLLFKTFELNGSRDEDQNRVLRAVLESLGPEDFDILSDKHNLEPGDPQPWVKHLTGGSDDHSGLSVARMCTEAPGARTVPEFLSALKSGRGRPRGEGSHPMTMAHNLYGIAYQFYRSRFKLDRYADRDLLMRFLDRFLRPGQPKGRGIIVRLRGYWNRRLNNNNRPPLSDKIKDLLRLESERLIHQDRELKEVIRSGAQAGEVNAETWFRFVDQVSNKVLFHLSENLHHRLVGGNFFSLFDSLGAAGSLYLLLAPYFIAYGLFGRDRSLSRKVLGRFAPPTPGRSQEPRIKVVHFTDTLYEVNGVALTIQQQAEIAQRLGKDLTVVTCADDKPAEAGRIRNFKPCGVYELPEYPEQKLFVPPFLEMLNFVYEGGYTHIHSSTPGPVGLSALGIARILNLPVSGTYHTAIPQYAACLTGDENIEQLAWRYTLWYYDQMDYVYTPSRETGQELVDKGLKPEKIRLYPRGVDVARFHPVNRNGFFDKMGLNQAFKILYVGRVSKEKNLPLLAEMFKKLHQALPQAHLIVIGDGPYLAEMKKDLAGRPCTFTGYLHGRNLCQAYASADLFVFPSTTDTFGNVVLEAQASGLPVVVTDTGGPKENLKPGETGLVVPGGDVSALVKACLNLAKDPLKLKQMAKAARTYTELRSLENAFLGHWRMYGQERVETAFGLAQAG